MGITEELRYAAAKVVNAGKLAVGSAVSQVGLQVKGELKKNGVMVEEMMQLQLQAKVEEEMCSNSNTWQQSSEENLKRLFDEPQPQPQPLNNTTPTKIFIRSRL